MPPSLHKLGYKSYSKYLASARWRKRKELFSVEHPKICSKCGSQNNIELHHRTYKNIGMELDIDLMWLCHECHCWAEKLIKSGKIDRTLNYIYDGLAYCNNKEKLKSSKKKNKRKNKNSKSRCMGKTKSGRRCKKKTYRGDLCEQHTEYHISTIV